jgi:hypothetical protein
VAEKKQWLVVSGQWMVGATQRSRPVFFVTSDVSVGRGKTPDTKVGRYISYIPTLRQGGITYSQDKKYFNNLQIK